MENSKQLQRQNEGGIVKRFINYFKNISEVSIFIMEGPLNSVDLQICNANMSVRQEQQQYFEAGCRYGQYKLVKLVPDWCNFKKFLLQYWPKGFS